MLAIAVFFGLQSRFVAKDPCEVLATMHQKVHSGHHEENLPCDPLHDENCPPEHHHHCGAVWHLAPLVSENEINVRLPWLSSSDLRPSEESDLIPEDPYLSSEKPPII